MGYVNLLLKPYGKNILEGLANEESCWNAVAAALVQQVAQGDRGGL